ncbi:F-box protein At3g07870-like [Papaver somniferum]|uniref:F-box protein At3g07870-like n=1 Tax=Papaver somniferum TaxID=3469 RepID=UPI000E6FCED5|nr:F-box protein At3g07870-like [Papaver somniferum]
MENLPTDITENILFRLSMEARLQIKPVCKTWRNLIGCNKTGLLFAFADVYDDMVPDSRTDLQLCYGDRQELNPDNDQYCSNKTLTKLDSIKYILQPLHCISDNHMVGSCNGLVCHYLNNQDTKGTSGGICNPVTGESFVLPRPKRPKYVGWFVLGFGYLPSTNEYKDVRWCCEWLNSGWQGYVEVCTLGSQSGWRGMENVPYKMQFSQSGLFVNGAIHWICETGRKMCKIVAYDLSDEKFKNVSSPPFDFFKRGDGVSGRLELMGGNLCAIV